jgi:hypothetical protein
MEIVPSMQIDPDGDYQLAAKNKDSSMHAVTEILAAVSLHVEEKSIRPV